MSVASRILKNNGHTPESSIDDEPPEMPVDVRSSLIDEIDSSNQPEWKRRKSQPVTLAPVCDECGSKNTSLTHPAGVNYCVERSGPVKRGKFYLHLHNPWPVGYSQYPPIPDVFQSAKPPIMRRTIGGLADEFPALREPVIDGLLRRGETGNLISVSKVGKSWLVYYILFSFVLKRMIFGRFATSGGRALLIDNELHGSTLASRLQTVARAMGIAWDEVKDLIDVWSLRGNLRTIYEIGAEFDDIPTGTYALIVADAKYRMLGEDEDENSNADATRFANEVDRVAEMTGAALLGVHHSSKGQQGDKRVVDVGSGAGAQSRAVDGHFILREHQEEDHVVFEAAVRSFKPVEPVGLRWNFPLWEVADDLDTARLKGKQSAGQEQQNARDRETDDLILKKAHVWVSRTELRTLTGYSPDRLNRGICRLIAADQLDQMEEERKGNSCTVFQRKNHAF